jgi:hypothetical protein
MRPATTCRRIAYAAISAIGMSFCVATYAQQPTSGAPTPAAKPGGSPVHSIVLPQYPPLIAPGPNVDAFRKNCLICHTARYVSMQPRFSKTVWQNEVKKMVDVYGAPIAEADQALIVEYLVAVKGAGAPAALPAPTKWRCCC